jgi:hypothetical protein
MLRLFPYSFGPTKIKVIPLLMIVSSGNDVGNSAHAEYSA